MTTDAPKSTDPLIDETVAHLQALVRLDTSNPPGREMAVARYLDTVLREAGVETWLDEPAPDRAAFIARIRGDGSQRPLLLMAHMDVVGVEAAKWSVPRSAPRSATATSTGAARSTTRDARLQPDGDAPC
ncbi:MAG: hypothetical protein IPF87_21320 [Gemmatimonadetes bacterium]|nr:hypothetical protein [Gemmatimonadota bacterium]